MATRKTYEKEMNVTETIAVIPDETGRFKINCESGVIPTEIAEELINMTYQATCEQFRDFKELDDEATKLDRLQYKVMFWISGIINIYLLLELAGVLPW